MKTGGKNVPKLMAKQRSALPKKDFALPGSRFKKTEVRPKEPTKYPGIAQHISKVTEK